MQKEYQPTKSDKELLKDVGYEIVGNFVIDGKGDGKGGALQTATRQREHET